MNLFQQNEELIGMVVGVLFLQEIILEAPQADHPFDLADLSCFFSEDALILLVIERNRGILIEQHGRSKKEQGGQSQVDIAIAVQVIKQLFGILK